MKLMIASDIHGSAYYCEKLIEAYKDERPDKLLLLGDYLYHGPRNDLPDEYDPKKVAAMLNEISMECIGVRGNCDSEVDQMMLEFPMLADYLPLFIDGLTIYVTHGHIYNQKKPLPLKGGIVLYGHTHVPTSEETDGVIYLNPGSASIPKQDSKHSYMIYENGAFCWKDLLDKEIYKEYKVR